MGGIMNINKNRQDLFDAMYDHRTITLSLTGGKSVSGRISGVSHITVKVGMTPVKYFRIDQIESVKLHRS